MVFKKCEYCGEPFSSTGSKVCAKCAKELDHIFTQVRKFIYNTDGEVSVANIVEGLEVPEKAVLYLLDSGRLVSEGRISGLGRQGKCRACGKPVPYGTAMCMSCSKTVNEGLLKFKIEQRSQETDGNRKKAQPMWTAKTRTKQ